MGEERGCIGSWWGNRRERGHWGDLGVDGWIILRRISRRWDVGIWNGLEWPRGFQEVKVPIFHDNGTGWW